VTERWRREPCPAELPIGGMQHVRKDGKNILTVNLPPSRVFRCQAEQVYQGQCHRPINHDHVWAGWVGDQWVRVNWRQKRGGS